jgi:hypothetical protein
VRVHPDDTSHFTPVYFGVLIDAGYMTDWPHEWTQAGARAVRRNVYDDGGYNASAVWWEAIKRLPPEATVKP